MSQILDSLRRSRKVDGRSTPSRTAQGDAVLATLGYAQSRAQKRYLPAILIAFLILVLAGVGWTALRSYVADRRVPGRRVLAPTMQKPGALARPTAPALAAPPNVDVSDVQTAIPHSAITNATEVSSVGRRTARRGDVGSTAAIANPAALPSISPDRPALVEARMSDAGAKAPSSRDNDLEMALYYHRAGDFANALQLYRALLARDELNAQVHNNLGLLYQERNLLDESSRELRRAVLIEPSNASTRNNYGATLLMLGRLDEAAAEFKTALSLDPRNVDALVNLSLAARKSGQPDVAKETLLRALNLAPKNAAAHYNLGQLYDETNEPARAVEHYRLFLEHAGAEHATRGAAVRARIAALTRSQNDHGRD